MSFKPIPTLTIVLLLLFIALHLCAGASLAATDSHIPDGTPGLVPQQPMGILTTQGNTEISVNEINSIGGATILSGSSIETPAGVSATILIPSRGLLEIEPSTKLRLEIDQSGFKAVLNEGCIHLHTKKGTVGEIITPQGSAGKTDPAKDDKVETCPSRSAAPIASAGAGGLIRLGTKAAVAIIAKGATAAAVPVAPRGVLY